MFIAFFFLKDEKLFANIIGALVPDKHEANAREAYKDIEHLLSRYFIGLIVEIFGIALIDFLGLVFIVRLGFNASIGIAFICGVLNIIPYVGPFIGGVIGTVLNRNMVHGANCTISKKNTGMICWPNGMSITNKSCG